MSTRPNFDTHLAYIRLTESGFDEKKANQIVDLLKDSQNDLADKSDIKDLAWQIKGLYAMNAIILGWLAWISIKVIAMSEMLIRNDQILTQLAAKLL